MSDTWQKFNTWSHTKKMLILILAIAIFFPIDYFLLFPYAGAIWSIVAYFVYLIIMAILVRQGKRPIILALFIVTYCLITFWISFQFGSEEYVFSRNDFLGAIYILISILSLSGYYLIYREKKQKK